MGRSGGGELLPLTACVKDQVGLSWTDEWVNTGKVEESSTLLAGHCTNYFTMSTHVILLATLPYRDAKTEAQRG